MNSLKCKRACERRREHKAATMATVWVANEIALKCPPRKSINMSFKMHQPTRSILSPYQCQLGRRFLFIRHRRNGHINWSVDVFLLLVDECVCVCFSLALIAIAHSEAHYRWCVSAIAFSYSYQMKKKKNHAYAHGHCRKKSNTQIEQNNFMFNHAICNIRSFSLLSHQSLILTIHFPWFLFSSLVWLFISKTYVKCTTIAWHQRAYCKSTSALEKEIPWCKWWDHARCSVRVCACAWIRSLLIHIQ